VIMALLLLERHQTHDHETETRTQRSATGRFPGTGYLERMARPRLTESARVSIALKVSQVDATRIDEVLTRPEFAGWTRAEWCREIVRTALRYYVGDASAPDPGQAPVPARPAAAQRVPPEPAPAGAPPRPAEGPPSRAGEPGAGGAGAATPMPSAAGEARPPAVGEAVPPAVGEARPPVVGEPRPGGWEAPERPAETECSHPAEARDWQTGTCAACGAILWD
jgi:hypothetical protein